MLVGFFQEPDITVLATVVNAKDGDDIASHPVRDHRAPAVMLNLRPGSRSSRGKPRSGKLASATQNVTIVST